MPSLRISGRVDVICFWAAWAVGNWARLDQHDVNTTRQVVGCCWCCSSVYLIWFSGSMQSQPSFASQLGWARGAVADQVAFRDSKDRMD